LARAYRAIDEEDSTINAAQLDDLVMRVDIVPVSLAIAQSALESGWGTSSYTSRGNSLFGQMSWGESAMEITQSAEHGSRGLAAFKTPLESVIAYMRNLNRHYAYAEFRKVRAEMRESNVPITGSRLAKTLDSYSTRRGEYIDHVLSMIKSSDLEILNETYLSQGTVYILNPKSAGS